MDMTFPQFLLNLVTNFLVLGVPFGAAILLGLRFGLRPLIREMTRANDLKSRDRLPAEIDRLERERTR